jgi:aminoglycoside 6'-N-acetyltransferase I
MSRNGEYGVRITWLSGDDPDVLHQTAEVMVEGFAQIGSGYVPNLAAALHELSHLLAESYHLSIAVAEDGTVAGLIGGKSGYDGNVWELHPLVVRPGYQGKGIGRRLVAHLETLAREQGALTLWLGTDDEAGLTSLGGINLYPDPLEPLRAIRNLHGHPYEFYRKCGFAIAGALPDANGYGKPDIFMAKRIGAVTAPKD